MVDVSAVRAVLAQIRSVVSGDIIMPEDHNLQTQALTLLTDIVESIPAAIPGEIGVAPARDFYANAITLPTTPTQITTNPTPIRAIALLAPPSNSAPVYFRSINQSTGGGIIPPGMGLVLEIDDASKVEVWSTTDGQMLSYAYELRD